jgi:hypothetical protein
MSSLTNAIEDERRCDSIHPAIDYALSAFPPRIARQAEGPIRLMLGDGLTSETSDARGSSRLTGDRFPFEIAFCTADDRLRFTIEPGASDLDPRHRLEVASELMREMSESVPPDVLDDLCAMQSDRPLTYGAWIGCRVDGEGMALKLYAEVPPGGQTAGLYPAPRLSDRTVVPQILAYTPATQEFESYFRVASLEPRHLPAVLAPAGIETQSQWLVGFVEEAYGYVVRGRLPGPSVGISYAAGPTRRRVTLHFYARAIWGSDARIRRGFSRVASACAWDERAYLHVTAPIAARESWKTFHGLFGITLEQSQPISLSIGVRPVKP